MALLYQVAAEEQTENEDENGRPKHHDVDIQRKVLESYIRHPEAVVKRLGAHRYSGRREEGWTE